MNNTNFQLAFYDVVAILIPGIMFPGIIGLLWDPALEFFSWNSWLMLAGAFALGHLIQASARWFYETIVDRVFPPSGYLHSTPRQFQDLIREGLNYIYQTQWKPETLRHLQRDLCYSPVWNRMDNYKIFVALADLHRGLGFLSIVLALISVPIMLGCVKSSLGQWHGAALSVASVIAFYMFTSRMRFFRRLSEIVIYHSFLAYVAEQEKAK